MGLAGTKVKQRFGLDPRNTNWANDTDRFGAKHLSKLGWQPGTGLGLVPHSTTTHVKVVIKDDNMGLGAKLARKQKKDEFDSGECTGLDVFQRLLGRLNGKEDEISEELERQRTDKILNGKWGINFVKGDVLRSTWDAESKKLIQKDEGEKKQKRKLETDDDKKSVKKAKKEKKEKKERKDKSSKRDKVEKKDSDPEIKKTKKDKKDKKVKKDKKDKKEKKEKKVKKDKTKDTVTRESMLRPKEATPDQPPVISTRLSVRSRWIKQKRAAVMDAKALNEIFMVTN